MVQLEVLRYISESSTHPTPLLFVHGAWHGAWCWEKYFLPYFSSNGYSSYAMSLRGHGNSESTGAMVLNSIRDYVADVAQISAQIEQETGTKPILIGHSMGGYILQKYLEKHTAPAVILLASIPVMGTFPFQLRLALHHFLPTLKAMLTLKGYAIVEKPAYARKFFFSQNISDIELHTYHAQMQDESLRIILESGYIARPNPKKVARPPILVIAAENDEVFTVKEEIKTAQAYGTEAIIIPDIAHDVMLEAKWRTVADHILGWLETHNF